MFSDFFSPLPLVGTSSFKCSHEHFPPLCTKTDGAMETSKLWKLENQSWWKIETLSRNCYGTLKKKVTGTTPFIS